MSNNYGFRVESTEYSGQTCLVTFLDTTLNETFELGTETIPFNYFPTDGTPQGKVFIYFSGTDQTFVIDITTPNPSPTPTSTVTPTPTSTVTPTSTITPTPSITPTSTVTPTVTVTPTNTVTPSITPTVTATPTSTVTPTATVTVTPTETPTVTPTETPTSTPTETPTPTVTSTETPTVTPTVTTTPTVTSTETPTVTPTITTTPTVTPTSSNSTPTPTPTVTSTPQPVVSGLIIELDAYNSSSYSGSGTNVVNLQSPGTYDHTLVGATFTTLNTIKCFDCTTGTQRVVVNGTGPTLPTTGYTYITWARLELDNIASFRTLLYTNSSKYTPITIPNNSNTLGYWDNAFRSSGYDLSGQTSVWVQYAVVGTNSSQKFYINGSEVGSPIAFGAGGTTHWGWGNNDLAGQPWGYVANMYFYNRQLSLSEIQQQYNFLAPRFVEPTPTPTATNTPTVTKTPTVTPTNTVTPSSTPVSPVSSGLELYYDPSNSSSYPGSGTTLYDLSSSAVNATIGGSPTYSGNSFTFAGAQSIVTGNLSGLFAGWQHSIEIWFNASAIGAVFSDTGTGPTNTGYHATGLEVYPVGPFYLTNAMLWDGAVTRVGGGTVGLNTWYQLVRVYNGSNTSYAYLNKVKSSDTSITWITPTPGWYLNFGSSETTNFATGAAFQGKIGVVRLYNRVLSLAEVTQNFNADKSKYGL